MRRKQDKNKNIYRLGMFRLPSLVFLPFVFLVKFMEKWGVELWRREL